MGRARSGLSSLLLGPQARQLCIHAAIKHMHIVLINWTLCLSLYFTGRTVGGCVGRALLGQGHWRLRAPPPPSFAGAAPDLRSVCLASAVSDGHGRPARGLLVCLPLERGEDPGVRGGQRRPQLQSIFCHAQLRACALSSVPSQEIFKYIAYL